MTENNNSKALNKLNNNKNISPLEDTLFVFSKVLLLLPLLDAVLLNVAEIYFKIDLLSQYVIAAVVALLYAKINYNFSKESLQETLNSCKDYYKNHIGLKGLLVGVIAAFFVVILAIVILGGGGSMIPELMSEMILEVFTTNTIISEIVHVMVIGFVIGAIDSEELINAALDKKQQNAEEVIDPEVLPIEEASDDEDNQEQ